MMRHAGVILPEQSLRAVETLWEMISDVTRTRGVLPPLALQEQLR
jgi:hypothetical protein